MKHAAFVNTLLAQVNPPLPRDILTIFSFDHELREQWGGLLGMSDAEADVMLEVMGISPRDVDHLNSFTDCPQALLIKGGDRCWHTPVYGGLNNPFSWVNRKLQRTFRSDWDRAVNHREDAFRDDLSSLFPEPRFHIPAKPKILKHGRRVLTDVDAVVFDTQTGRLAAFQLKWQDPFETSLKERASRRSNLIKEGNSWVSTLLDYCEALSGMERAVRLGIPEAMAVDAKAMLPFVLTRNGTQFSGDRSQDSRAAWLSWFDLVKRLHSLNSDDDPLTAIWTGARIPSPSKVSRQAQSFELKGVRIEQIL